MKHHPHASRLARTALAAALASAFAAPPAHALDVVWLGGTGNWSTESGWSGGLAPNASDVDVFIDGGNAAASAVTFSTSATIGKLNIGAGDALTLGNGSALTLGGGSVVNNGTLTLAGTDSATRLALNADTTLAGSGRTVIGDSPNNHVYGNGNFTLTVANGHTLSGGGQLGSTTYGPLYGLVNQGTIRADAAGGMSIYAGSVDNTQGVVQVANGSFITLQAGNLYGGTISGAGSAYLSGSGVYRDTTLTGTLKVKNGDSLNVAGTLTNNGTLTLAATDAATRLVLNADTTLAGSGRTVIGDSPNNHIYGNGNFTLTVASGHTVSGGGQLGSSAYGWLNGLVNQGTIRADAASGMSIYAGSVDNRSGTLDVASNSTLSISGSLLLGNASLLKIGVSGLQQGTQYGLLSLSDSITFDGVVQLDLSGYAAHVGDSFTFLTLTGSASGSGSFDAVTANGYALDVTYFADHVTATVTAITAVPEPGSLALMLAGLGVMGWLARRRVAVR